MSSTASSAHANRRDREGCVCVKPWLALLAQGADGITTPARAKHLGYSLDGRCFFFSHASKSSKATAAAAVPQHSNATKTHKKTHRLT